MLVGCPRTSSRRQLDCTNSFKFIIFHEKFEIWIRFFEKFLVSSPARPVSCDRLIEFSSILILFRVPGLISEFLLRSWLGFLLKLHPADVEWSRWKVTRVFLSFYATNSSVIAEFFKIPSGFFSGFLRVSSGAPRTIEHLIKQSS